MDGNASEEETPDMGGKGEKMDIGTAKGGRDGTSIPHKGKERERKERSKGKGKEMERTNQQQIGSFFF
jgi:hypothetical protein